MHKNFINLILLSIVIFCSLSCVNTQKATYFNNAQDAIITPSNKDTGAVIIQKNDILSIVITSLSQEASVIFNSPNVNTSNYTASGSNQSTGGYLVNAEGAIQLPILGTLKVEGLSKTQLKEQITNTLVQKKLLTDPIVTIRHLNFEVTVIGEVAKPSVITVPSEKLSLLKALGLAGDITTYGSKGNVLLIRENNGKRIVKRIDLNSAEFLASPNYYLQPNDVIYVEANKDKVSSTSRIRQSLPVIISALSFGVVALSVIFRK